MSNIVNTICQLTKGEYWSNKQNFEKEFTSRFYNGKEILEKVGFENCNQFHDNGCNAELLIYNDRQCIYSCCYEEWYSQKIITCIYGKQGLVYNYDIDCEALKNQFGKKKRSK